MRVYCHTRCYDNAKTFTFREGNMYNLTDRQVARMSVLKRERHRNPQTGRTEYGDEIPGTSMLDLYFDSMDEAPSVQEPEGIKPPEDKPGQEDLDSLSKEDLLNIAHKRGVNVSGRSAKKEIIEAIRTNGG